MHRLGLIENTWHTDVTPGGEPKIRNRAIKACHECRTRKAKCDKAEPKCHNCRRNHRDCVYMRGKPDVSRIKRKARDIEDKRFNLPRVKSELGLSSQGDNIQDDDSSEGETPLFESAVGDARDLLSNPLAVADAAYDDDADDDDANLEQFFGVGHFSMTDRIGGFFRPKLSEEITRTLRSSHPSDTNNYWHPDSPVLKFTSETTYKKPDLALLFSNASRENVDNMRLSKEFADPLFEQYWMNVHPISRIVHKSSLVQLYQEIYGEDQSTQLPNSAYALVFVSLFAGLVSMDWETYNELFKGDSKTTRAAFEDSMQRLTETVLGYCSLAHTKDLRALQALVAYLIVLCRAHIGRSHLTLVASAVRLAESIGLHRDGTEYDRDPIAVHVRRLIWHQLCILDVRTTESAAPRPLIRRKEYSTEFPLNLDDEDLHYCDQSSDRFTDMTSSLVDMRCIEVIRSLYKDRANNRMLEDGRVSLDALLIRVADFRERLLKDYGDFLDERVPIQNFTKMKIDLYTSRMYAILLQPYLYQAKVELPARLLELFVARGVENLEVSMAVETHPMFRPWQWYLGAIHQHHYAFGMLMEIHMRPDHQDAERVWKCLEWVFDVPPKYRPIAMQEKTRLVLTEVRDQLIEYAATQRLRCSRDITDATMLLDNRSFEQDTSSDGSVSYPGSTVGTFSASSIVTQGLPDDMKPLLHTPEWLPHSLPEKPMRSLLRSAGEWVEGNKERDRPRDWKLMGTMHSEALSERRPAPNHHYLQHGRPNAYYTEPISHPPVSHTFNGRHVPTAAAQQLNHGHPYISHTNHHAHTVPEPLIDPIEGESISENGMMSAPYRPSPVAYSFDGSASPALGNQMGHGYGYGHPYAVSFDHASNYGHQPVEQHHDNSFGGQEHQDHAGPVEYRNSSYRRSTQ